MLQCQNNIKQLALGCLDHESAIKRFPTGGWGFAWAGDPDRGNDWHQPGGWTYNVLPYIEQQALHDLGMEPLGNATKELGTGQRIGTALPYANCPTRRRPLAYPPYPTWLSWFTYCHTNFALPQAFVRSDYAMNGGEYWTYAHWKTPVQNVFAGPSPAVSNGVYTYVDAPNARNDVTKVMTDLTFSPFGWDPWPQGIPGPARANGVSFALSMIKAGDVTDGLSNTYLLGEKSLWSDHYTDGYSGGDNEFALQGFDTDNYRFANDYTTAKAALCMKHRQALIRTRLGMTTVSLWAAPILWALTWPSATARCDW